MTCQEDPNGYQLPAHANPLLPASRPSDGQGREPVPGSSGLHAHRRVSHLSRQQASGKTILTRRHQRHDVGPAPAGDTRVLVPGAIATGPHAVHEANQKFRANQRSTTCVVPPVAAVAERPPGAAAACTSTPSCPGSHPRSDAPATHLTRSPCGGSHGAKAEAPQTGPHTPASRGAAGVWRRPQLVGQLPRSLVGE